MTSKAEQNFYIVSAFNSSLYKELAIRAYSKNHAAEIWAELADKSALHRHALSDGDLTVKVRLCGDDSGKSWKVKVSCGVKYTYKARKK